MMSEDLTSNQDLSTRDLKPIPFGFGLFRNKYVWLAMVPFVLVLLVIGYRGIGEWQADQANQRQINQWAKAGVPYDNASMQTAYLQQTFPEGHADWARVLRLTVWGSRMDSYMKLPYLSNGEVPEVLIPDDKANQWKNKALVAGYLAEMQPVIDLVEQASMHPTPVRFPMHFQGHATLLPHTQLSRNILRILSLDCDYAYTQNDTQRALRDLSLMRSTAEAFDSRDFIVSLLVNNAVCGMRFGAVRRTLPHCAWDESQLAALRKLVSTDEDVAAPLREAMLNERAMAVASISDGTSLEDLNISWGEGNTGANRQILPSDKQLLIECYNDLLAGVGESMLQWEKRMESLERRIKADHSNSIAALILPGTSQIIASEIATEERRRWTLTAVALRQYHQQNGSWPKQLSGLEALGLVFDDYSNMYDEIFGYEVDGETAYLWKSERNSKKVGRVSATRPTEPKEGESLDSYLLELH